MSEKLWDDGEEIDTQASNHEESSLDPEQEYYRDEVDAPAAMVERMRAAAAARGEGRLNSFSAKKILREFGSAMNAEPGQRKTRAQRVDMRALGGYTASGEDSRDPKPLDGVISYLIRSRGWKEPVAVSSVMARWSELVGPELATHAKPTRFENAVVDVQCDSTAWATQLRLMRNQIVQMFARELGEGVVTNIRIYGPNNGRWASRGPKRAPGGRGVRDTYG